MQPHKQCVHKINRHKGTNSKWIGSCTETRIIMVTQDLHPNSDAFPWGAWPRDAAVTRTSKQAGKALRSQGHQYARVM